MSASKSQALIVLPPIRSEISLSRPISSASPSSVSAIQPLARCKRVFQALINISIEELCETGNALLAPVRLGVARPTAPFSLSGLGGDSSAMDELFNVDPVARSEGGGERERSRRRRRDEEREEGREARSAALRPRRNDTGVSAASVLNDTVEMDRDDQDDPAEEDNNDNGGDDGGDDDADDRPDDAGAGERVGEAEGGGGEDDGHHSDMDLDLLAESESESEGEGEGAEGGDAGSTAAAQSIQTGATAGSDALFSDDESAESSHPDDVERRWGNGRAGGGGLLFHGGAARAAACRSRCCEYYRAREPRAPDDAVGREDTHEARTGRRQRGWLHLYRPF